MHIIMLQKYSFKAWSVWTTTTAYEISLQGLKLNHLQTLPCVFVNSTPLYLESHSTVFQRGEHQKLELCGSIWENKTPPLSSFSTQLRVSQHQVKEMGQIVLFAVLLLTLAAAGCQANCDNHDHLCYLYPSYHRLEDCLVNNSQMFYLLQQAFFLDHLSGYTHYNLHQRYSLGVATERATDVSQHSAILPVWRSVGSTSGLHLHS